MKATSFDFDFQGNVDNFVWDLCPVHLEEFPESHGCASCADEERLRVARERGQASDSHMAGHEHADHRYWV